MNQSYRPNKRPNPYFCRFTFGQFFTLMVLEVFTLFFLFYLGARYGREFLGFSTNVPSIAVKEEGPTLEMTDPNVVATVHDPEIKALAKDLVKASPTPDLKQRVNEMLQESYQSKTITKATKEENKKPETGMLTSPKGTQIVTKTSQPPPKTAPSAEVSTALKNPSPTSVQKVNPPKVIQTNPFGSKYSIQVGSYENVDEAHSMVGHWKERGYPAFLVSADLPGKGRWYRVRMGGFDDQEAAVNYMGQFKAKEKVEAFVAPND